MLPTYMNFLKKPVDQEFFTKFTAIFSRDESGNAVALRLTPSKELQSNAHGYTVYCDKIRIGETIDTAVQRTMNDEFGLNVVDYYVPVFSLDVEKNKTGKSVTRIPIVAYTSYGLLNKSPLVECDVKWVERDTYEYHSCEALQWLQKNVNSVLFDHEEHSVSRDEMVSFVEKLYVDGAIDITLGNTNEQFYEYPEPGYIFVPNYIEIRLPKNIEMRKNIQIRCKKGIQGRNTSSFEIPNDRDTVRYYFT